MELLVTGDACPCCGQPIQTQDLWELYLLTHFKLWKQLDRGEISYRDYMILGERLSRTYEREVYMRGRW